MRTYPVTNPAPPGNGSADPSSTSAPLPKMSKYPETVSSNGNDAFIVVRAALLVICTHPVTRTRFGNQPAREVRSVFSMMMLVVTSATSS